MISTINSLDSLNPLKIALDTANKTQDDEILGKSFQELLDDAITDVNDTQVNGYNSMKDIATGKVENLQEAVRRIGEADLTLKFALEVKTKAVNAYREVMRMQV